MRIASIRTHIVGEVRPFLFVVVETEDGIELTGDSRLQGGVVSSGGDHRILMAFAVGATAAASRKIAARSVSAAGAASCSMALRASSTVSAP